MANDMLPVGQMPSTLAKPVLKSGADWLASATPEVQAEFLDGLTEGALLALPFLFEFWALEHQLPPGGDWRNWVIMGGRGAGKTRAGAEWVRAQVEGDGPLDAGACRRVALVGETIDQVREVMIFGDSGIMACSPPDRRPEWVASRKRLVWPNGAEAAVCSAHDPEGLRGPQFDAAWADELAKWKRAGDVWDMLQFCLRLGSDPRCVVTTTPRNVPVLKALLAAPTTVTTHAPTSANRANLASGFLAEVERRYAGTRLGRQELEGVLLDDVEGALWTSEMLEAVRVDVAPQLDRIVVAVDPPVTGHAGSDACGIVVAGVQQKGSVGEWRVAVLEDASVEAASPAQWAEAAVAAFHRHGADRLVAEVNQGGDLVAQIVRQVDPNVPYTAVRASKGKAARAEPVAALYEQGRVAHLRDLGALEDEMCRMSVRGYEGVGSPDRLDALVWAVTELVVKARAAQRAPGIRAI